MTDIAPGFRKVSGKRSPARDGRKWFVQLRTGFYSVEQAYTVEQLKWVHDGGPGDVIAVRDADKANG